MKIRILLSALMLASRFATAEAADVPASRDESRAQVTQCAADLGISLPEGRPSDAVREKIDACLEKKGIALPPRGQGHGPDGRGHHAPPSAEMVSCLQSKGVTLPPSEARENGVRPPKPDEKTRAAFRACHEQLAASAPSGSASDGGASTATN